VGDEMSEGGRRYAVERVEPPPNPDALGHAWVRLVMSERREIGGLVSAFRAVR
jgi:hypothetical protein